jgi:flagellar motor switch protein FliN/FliY
MGARPVSVEFGPVHSLPAEELEPGSLLDLGLRAWAEIGRTRMPASSVVGMAEGAILDLDREPDEPADLFVNGRHFGTGRLIMVDGEWALRVESLDHDEDPASDDAEPVEQASNGASDGAPASD